jgi:NAD(P)-dependent dehydrogenase (short-subunit alcohol dehydrogenase family)
MSDPLRGCSVLVTGASSGIGRALATALVGRGARVVAAARSADRLASLAAELGPACEAVTADVAKPADVERVVAGAGRLDAVINNAGVGHVEPFLVSDPAIWRATLDTNFVGALLVARAALPDMLAAGRGAVINVGSAAAAGWPYLALYTRRPRPPCTPPAWRSTASANPDAAWRAVLHVEIGPTEGTDFGIPRIPPTCRPRQAWTALGIPWSPGASGRPMRRPRS